MITFGILLILAASIFPNTLLHGQESTAASASSPLAFVDNNASIQMETQRVPSLNAILPQPVAPITPPAASVKPQIIPIPVSTATPPLPIDLTPKVETPAPPTAPDPTFNALPTPQQIIAPQPATGLAAILAPGEGVPTPPTQPSSQQEVAASATATADAANEEKKDIYLNFDNAELGSFINYIAEIKKLNLIPDKGIEGNKISLTIREPLSVEGAWNVFLTVLETAGFSIVQVGDVYKVIPKDKKGQQPLPAYINVPQEKIPDNDSSIRYVMILNNLQAADIRPLAESMMGANGSVLDVKEVNSLIITDKCYNIKTTVKVLQELDQMGTAETVTVIKLKTANAADVKALLDTIIKQPDVSPLARLLGKTSEGTNEFFPAGTRIIPEERTNSLILMGNPKPIKKIEEFIVNHIDTELKAAKSPLHVFELQYANATQIAEILSEVTLAGETPAGQAAAKYGAIRGGVKYFKKMNFKVDTEGNRLIVSSSDKVDWKLLKQTIKDLDKPQPQVAIETLIVTINVTDIKQLGGNIRNKKPGMLGTNIDFQSAASTGPSLKPYPPPPATAEGNLSLLGDMISQMTKQQGLSVLTFGKSGDLWGIFQTLQTQTNASILSQPFITVANKTKASISVGTVQRVLKEMGDNGKKGFGDATAKTTLELTPQINIDGIIKMHIHTEINEFEDPEATITTERKLDTDATVADGQVLVLGGFVKTKVTENKYKTPLLGDLPLLGWMFKTQKREVSKQYLFIFLSPTIIKPRQIPGMGLYTKMKLHEVTDSIESSIPTKLTPDPIHNWFFNPEKENYSHKVIDFANARYQPTTVDIKNDPYYRTQTVRAELQEEKGASKSVPPQPSTTDQKKESSQEPPPEKIPQLSDQLPTPLAQTIAPEKQLTENPSTENKLVETKNLISAPLPTIPQPPSQPSPTPILEPSQVIQEPTQAKREQFKELINPPVIQSNYTQAPIAKSTPPTTINKQEARNIFKNNLTSPAPTQPAEQLNINVNKRNSLKEFLSNNPAFARNAKLPNRRAIA